MRWMPGRAGKSAKRRQWRMQRGDFEEVPRLAATIAAGNQLARRWAREPRPYGGIQGVRWFLWCVGEGLCPSRGRGRTPPLRKRYMRCGADKGRPGGPPLRFLYPLFICALRRINLPGAGVCLCRPTRCGPRPGAFPGRWLFPPDKSRCGVRPGSPGPGL